MYRPEMFCHSIFSEIKTEDDHEDCDEFVESTKLEVDPLKQEENVLMPSRIVSVIDNSEAEEMNDGKRSKQQICHICNKILSSASSYYVHMKKHSNNKPYQCNQCDASFCRKPYLEVHMRTHTGEKPYECDICQKRFTQKSSLNTHKRCHTGQRPFSCEICMKKFSVKSYLVAHKWSHVSATGVACNVCQMSFNSKSQYLAHSQTHTAGFECGDCHKYFAKESFLIRHKTRLHNKSGHDQ